MRQYGADIRARHYPARLHADDLPEDSTVGVEIGERQIELGLGGGQTSVRLGDIRARSFADLEAVLRSPHLLSEELDVRPVERNDRGVADHVHVELRRREHDALLGRGQRGARSLDEGFCLPSAVTVRKPRKTACWIRSPTVAVL